MNYNINKHIQFLGLLDILKDWRCEIDEFDIITIKLTNLNDRMIEQHSNFENDENVDQQILKKIVKLIWKI